jgi:hypothetical protein
MLKKLTKKICLKYLNKIIKLNLYQKLRYKNYMINKFKFKIKITMRMPEIILIIIEKIMILKNKILIKINYKTKFKI